MNERKQNQVYEKIKSGASLAQLYTALVFQGPKIINQIKITKNAKKEN